MNRNDFIRAVAEKTKQPIKQTDEILTVILETITKTLAKGDDVVFVGFGSFKVKKRAARNGRNPRTGATIKIPARKVPHFSAGSKLKDVVNKR